jgi:hypothetical protein
MNCDQLRAEGQISLHGAMVGGELRFTGAQLASQHGPALDADGLTVTGDMFCSNGFHAVGGVNLIDARIGVLSFRAAKLTGGDELALVAERLTVTGAMLCDEGFHVEGSISLVGASVGVLHDEQKSWPASMNLDGLTYRDLKPYRSAGDRLRRFRLRSLSYRAQPYEQLAAYYRSLGHDEDARTVLLAKQRARTRQQPLWQRWWGWLQDGLAGYGYAPGRALALLAIALVAGWMYFRANEPPPVNSQNHPSFNAALYALDLLIPAPGLGQSGDWNPHGQLLVVAAGLRALGWLLAITVLTAITRALSRS